MKRQYLSILAAGLIASLAGCATTDPQPRLDTPFESSETRIKPIQFVTGSRIRQRVSDDDRTDMLSSHPLILISKEELERTGREDINSALMMIYPGLF